MRTIFDDFIDTMFLLDDIKPIRTPVNITVKKIGDTSKDTTLPEIKDVIFNKPATIVFWEDGTKTIVKCQKRDTYSKETGLAMAIAKKVYGNKGNYNDVFSKWIKE